MAKEIGPRERQLREQREARFEVQQAKQRELDRAMRANKPKELAALKQRVAVAALKTGKSRKKK